MVVKDLDGNEFKLSLRGKKKKFSALHKRATALIRKKYPLISYNQEVTIRIRGRQRLYLDIFISAYRLAIEVQGQQHFEYIPHFHASKRDFVLAQHKDSLKSEWCALNDITLIYFNFDEDENEWGRKLKKQIG